MLFNETVFLLQHIDGANWTSPRAVSGHMLVTSEMAPIVKILEENSIIDDIYTTDNEAIQKSIDWEKKLIGQTVNISLSFFTVGDIFQSFDSFLDYNDNRRIPPDHFYISDGCIDSHNITDNNQLKGYFDAIKLGQLLNDFSDIPSNLKKNSSSILFAGSKKLDLSIAYNSIDLRPLENIDTLIEELQSPIHFDEKKEIFKSTIIDFLLQEKKENRFQLLLNKYEFVVESYKESYLVYVRQFSIKQIKKEFEENKIDLANKLSTLMSELSKTLLTIPLAFIFIAPRIDNPGTVNFTNTVMVISFWIFACFTFLSFSNHKRTLRFISDEIDRQQDKIKTEYSDISNLILPAYKNLKDRCKYQNWTRISVGVTLWLGLTLLTGIYLYQIGILKITAICAGINSSTYCFSLK